MSYGVPFMLVMLPITWWVLCRVTLPFQFDGGTRESIRAAIGVMGTMGAPEKRVVAVVSLVALAWVFQPFVERHVTGITDAGIAIAGALLLALLPSGASGPGRPRTLLEWDDAKRAPWYLILLLGGGLALADAVVKSGLSAWLAQALGAEPLKPEKSKNFSLGFTLTPAAGLSLSVDAYQIDLDDRITLLRETNTTLEAIAQAQFRQGKRQKGCQAAVPPRQTGRRIKDRHALVDMIQSRADHPGLIVQQLATLDPLGADDVGDIGLQDHRAALAGAMFGHLHPSIAAHGDVEHHMAFLVPAATFG